MVDAMPATSPRGPRIGLALGSGAARGWAHLGVLRALEEIGVRPDLVTGTSAGALAGAAWLTDQIGELRGFAQAMGVFDIVTHFELAFGGGLIKADKAFARFRNAATDVAIERLPLPFACVATDLATGRAVTLGEGPLLPAVRASTAMPGLFPPVEIDGRWLSDGALVDPVPVGLARNMGADIVIAVHLNAGTAQLRRNRKPEPRRTREPSATAQAFADVQARVGMAIGNAARALGAKPPVQRPPRPAAPNLIETLAASIAIMQDQLSRARLAADPPDVVIAPPLAAFGILAFDRGQEMEEIGYRAALAMRQPLERALEARA